MSRVYGGWGKDGWEEDQKRKEENEGHSQKMCDLKIEEDLEREKKRQERDTKDNGMEVVSEQQIGKSRSSEFQQMEESEREKKRERERERGNGQMEMETSLEMVDGQRLLQVQEEEQKVRKISGNGEEEGKEEEEEEGKRFHHPPHHLVVSDDLFDEKEEDFFEQEKKDFFVKKDQNFDDHFVAESNHSQSFVNKYPSPSPPPSPSSLDSSSSLGPKKPFKKTKKVRKPERGKDIYCFCREPQRNTEFMIACDSCNEWYHGRCINMTPEEGEKFSDQEYICHRCRKEGQSSFSKGTNQTQLKFKCPHCPRHFGRRKELQTHIKGQHLKEDSSDFSDEFERSTNVSKKRQRDEQFPQKSKGEKRAPQKKEIKQALKRVKKKRTEGEEIVPSLSSETPLEQLEKTLITKICTRRDCYNPKMAQSKYCSKRCGVLHARFIWKISDTARQKELESISTTISEIKSKPSEQAFAADIHDLHILEEIEGSIQSINKQTAAIVEELARLDEIVKVAQETEDVDDEAMDEDDDVEKVLVNLLDCPSCGHPIAHQMFSRHIEQCFQKKESRGAHNWDWVPEADSDNFEKCNRVDDRKTSYCKRPKLACPLHSEKLDSIPEKPGQVCGWRAQDGSCCTVLKKKCDKHNNWEPIRRIELRQEQARLKIMFHKANHRAYVIQDRLRRRALPDPPIEPTQNMVPSPSLSPLPRTTSKSSLSHSFSSSSSSSTIPKVEVEMTEMREKDLYQQQEAIPPLFIPSFSGNENQGKSMKDSERSLASSSSSSSFPAMLLNSTNSPPPLPSPPSPSPFRSSSPSPIQSSSPSLFRSSSPSPFHSSSENPTPFPSSSFRPMGNSTTFNPTPTTASTPPAITTTPPFAELPTTSSATILTTATSSIPFPTQNSELLSQGNHSKQFKK